VHVCCVGKIVRSTYKSISSPTTSLAFYLLLVCTAFLSIGTAVISSAAFSVDELYRPNMSRSGSAEHSFKRHVTGNKDDGIVDVNESDQEVVMLHPTEAGDNPYYIGDAYDEQPSDISREWEIIDV
jgi:hypothetical protein